MSLHRIVRNEADQEKPLVYVSIYRAGRRRVGGYLAAAIAGGMLALVVAVAIAVLGGALISGGR